MEWEWINYVGGHLLTMSLKLDYIIEFLPPLKQNSIPCFPPLSFKTPLLSMHTFIRNVDDLLVIFTYKWYFYGKNSHLFFAGLFGKICKWSYHKSWRFKLLFAQGALNYSILNKRWINLSLCDKCKVDIKPLEPPLKYWLIQIICFHMVSYIQSKE